MKKTGLQKKRFKNILNAYISITFADDIEIMQYNQKVIRNEYKKSNNRRQLISWLLVDAVISDQDIINILKIIFVRS